MMPLKKVHYTNYYYCAGAKLRGVDFHQLIGVNLVAEKREEMQSIKRH